MRTGLVVLALAACSSHPPNQPMDGHGSGSDGASPDANPNLTEVALVPAAANRDVDLLFMIDDSPSMLDKQNNLKTAFPALVSQLSGLPGGLPSLHIGVVTSDLGTSATLDANPGPAIGSGQGSCAGYGKNGVLQTNGTTLVTDRFISDVDIGGGSRMKNYTGTLANAFSAIASVGVGGCGFEQSIEAAKRALQNTNENTGFLRPSANLGVIFLTDEDDCSMSHAALIGSDPALGPLQSFRCTRFGITCDQGGTTTDAMNQVGVKGSCHSNDTGAYLTKLGDYLTYFRGLKPDPRNVMIAALAGPAEPFEIELRTPAGGGTPIPALKHSCMYTDVQQQMEVADNGVRVTQLANSFTRSVLSSVCAPDDIAILQIGQQIGALVGNPCLLRDIKMPATCEVFDQRPGQADVQIPVCIGGPSVDCYQLVTDSAACPLGQHMKLVVMRSTAAPADTMSSVRCAL